MHELSVCLALMDEVYRVAKEADAASVQSISIRVGPLSGVDAGLLARAFDVARLGGIAERARLVVLTMPVRVRCATCGAESDVLPNRLLCGACGGHQTRVIQGTELTLCEVEMEVPQDAGTELVLVAAG